MTVDALQVTGPRRGTALFTAGWVGLALFGGLVVVTRGSSEVPFAVVVAVLALGVCVWYRMTSGKAAVIVGLILGALLGLEQAAYVVADLGSSDGSSWGSALLDAVGLAACVLVVVGGALGLTRGRRA